MTTQNEPQGNKLHVSITDYPEISVAECIEVPVVVEGKTTDEIVAKMTEGINGYFAAFPEKKEEIFKRRIMTIPLAN
ncbi:MAG TPA: hypothetical protein VH481_09530 [Nitrososphaeraceae archaeon]|jgi:hypothetical protein